MISPITGFGECIALAAALCVLPLSLWLLNWIERKDGEHE